MSVVVFVVASGLSWVLGTAFFGTIALLSSLLTVVVLWPIYLAAIGQIESATDYGESIANGSVNRSDRIDDTGTDANDPLEVLKQRYAAGKLSEAEFERRLDGLDEADARRSGRTEDRELESVLDDLERN